MRVTACRGRCAAGVLCLLALFAVSEACAAGFAARISPPRFEFRASPGDRIRDVVTIQNADEEAAELVVRSADWALHENGGVVIRPAELELPPGSCRPWIALERHRLTLAPRQTKRYRFEVRVPEDAPAGECRVALVIGAAPEGLPATDIGGLQVPFVGQLAVIVYVRVGDAAPRLEYAGARLRRRGGEQALVMTIRNTGNAHGRPSGQIDAVDADGVHHRLSVVPFPVLPGREFDILLQPDAAPPAWHLPLTLSGTLEWDGGSLRIDDRIQDASQD